MKLKNKLFIILVSLMLILFVISNTVFGTLIDTFKDSIDTTGTGDLKSTGGKILGVMQVIGTIIAVAMLMILGIKYMIGSAEQKAEYRKTMLPYFIGAILIFATTNLVDTIYKWAIKLGK